VRLNGFIVQRLMRRLEQLTDRAIGNPVSEGSHQRNNLDLIRFTAAMAVLFSHSYPISGQPNEPLVHLTHSLSLGTLAVYVFFIVSGFLIAQSWARDPNALRFLMRRALRILPGLYAFLLVSTLLIGPFLTELPLSEYFSTVNVAGYLRQLGIFWLQGFLPGVYVHNVFPIYFNGSLWSIRVEVACYLVALALGMVSLFSNKLVVTSVAIMVFALQIYVSRSVTGAYSFLYMDLKPSLDVASYFFTGSALYYWWPSLPKLHGAYALLAVVCILVLGGPHMWLVLHAALPFLIMSIAFHPTRHLSRFGMIGDYSYGIYIYAFPVQQTVMYFLGGRVPFAAFVLISMLGTVACAVLSWHLVEHPLLGLKPSRRGLWCDSPASPSPSILMG